MVRPKKNHKYHVGHHSSMTSSLKYRISDGSSSLLRSMLVPICHARMMKSHPIMSTVTYGISLTIKIINCRSLIMDMPNGKP